MTDLTYKKIEASEGPALATYLSGDTWPYLFHSAPTWESVIARISEGRFFGRGEEAFWVKKGTEVIGLIEVMKLSELAPLITIRLSTAHRGKGLGRQLLTWVTNYIFETYPYKRRIEARTREDNVVMRKLFNKCGYVKEAYYRRTTPTEDGNRLASVGYGMLREDWENKVVTGVPWGHEPFFSQDL